MGYVELVVGLLGGGGVALAAAFLLFGVARRAMKFVVRVAIFAVIVTALVIGGVTWWFLRSGTGKTNKPTNSRRR